MFRKLSFLISGILLFSNLSSAQVYELETNPVTATTSGVTPYDSSQFSHDNVSIEATVENITNDSFIVHWRYLPGETQQPVGWDIVGVCDNSSCRAEYGSWYNGVAQSSPVTFGPGVMAPAMAVHIYAPTSAPDGIGIYKVELTVGGQTDTLVFKLTKTATGISAISLKDNRVAIYPNPVTTGNNLNVFINKDLKATKAVIYNIIGREQMSLPVAADKELNTYNVSSLAPGIYMLRLTDAYGKVITSRKFSKH